MPTRPRLLPLLAVLVLLAAPAASAATYTVTLANGSTFESRYQPEEAGWDSSVLLLMTEYGNWIALENNDVVDVITDVESRGFGKVIDTKTVSLGILANDQPVPEESDGELSDVELLQQLMQQQAPAQDFTVDQFVEPSAAGQGGLPVGYTQQPSSPPLVIRGRQ